MKRAFLLVDPSRRHVASCLCLVACLSGSAAALRAQDAEAVKEALRTFKVAVNSRDVKAVDQTALSIVQLGGAKAMRGMLNVLEKIPASEDALYWSVLQGVVSFVDPPALEDLGKFILDQKSKPLAKDLLYALAGNTSPCVASALKPVGLKGPETLKILAVTKLSKTCTHGSVDALLEILKQEDKASPGKPSQLALMAAEGLSSITGQDFGPSPINWEGWWEKNRKKSLKAASEDKSAAPRTGTAVDFVRVTPDLVRRKAFFGLEKAPLKSVVVLTAIYTKKLKRDLNNDHMEKVLTNMKIPHEVVRREDFLKYDLSKAGALLVNCAQFHRFCICPNCKPGGNKNERLYRCTGCNVHEEFTAELTEDEVKKIKNFVNSGGFLFCEDWIVTELVKKAFPGFIDTSVKLREPDAKLGEDKGVKLLQDPVDVVPVRGMGTHPYLKGIFEPKVVEPIIVAVEDPDPDSKEGKSGPTVVAKPEPKPEESAQIGIEAVKVKHTWTIDDESYAVKVVDKNRVVPLLTSGDLQKITDGNSLVALAFRPGGAAGNIPPGQKAPRGAPGVVAVVLSHFGKQESSSDEHSIQNLLLNFLIDANTAREGRAEQYKRISEKKDGKGKKGGEEPEDGKGSSPKGS